MDFFVWQGCIRGFGWHAIRLRNGLCVHPIALDVNGKVTERYAPPATIAPDLKCEETMIASFLIIDKQGKIRFLSLNEDTAKFDAKLTKLRARLDMLLTEK